MKKRVIALLLAVCLATGGEGLTAVQAAQQTNTASMITEAEADQAEEENETEVSQEETEQTEPVVESEEKTEAEVQTELESEEGQTQETGITEEEDADVEEKTEETEAEVQTEDGQIQTSDADRTDNQKEVQEDNEKAVELFEESEDVQVEKLDEAEVEKLMEAQKQQEELMVETETVGAGDYYEKEFNNSREEANAVSIGTTIHGSITNNDPVDFYKVTLSAAGELKLKIRSKLECYTVALYEGGTDYYVYENENWWNSALQEVTNTHSFYLEGGTWYIQITGSRYFQDANSKDYYVEYTGDYTCGVTFKKSVLTETELNDTYQTADALSFGKTMKGQLSWGNSVDYYKFSVSKPGKVNLTATAWIGEYQIELYDSAKNDDGELIRLWYERDIDWDASKGKSERSWDYYLEAGTYYICMKKGYYSENYRGLYQLKATCTDSKTTFTGSDNNAAEAKKISWNKTYTGQISLNDDMDLYKITMSSGRNVPLTITSYMPSYRARIYNAAGTEVWNSGQMWRENGKTSRKDEFVVTLGRGTYYMEITDGSWDQYTGTYKFNFSAGKLSSLKLSKKTVKLEKGDTYKLKAIMSPVSVKVSWKSSNSKVVSVKSGQLTAKGYGKATITCTAQDGSKKTTSCTVTVVPSKAQISSVKNTGSGKKFSIKTQSGVTGYEVYTKTSRESWKLYKTIKGSKSKSFTVKNSYYNSHSFKVRAYKVVGGKKYYGAFSKAI